MEEIRKGECLQLKSVLYTYSTGNNLGNLYFLWRVPEDESESELLTRSQAMVRKVEATIPTYHTRAMRKQFMHDFELLVKLEPKVLREMYRCLTGDTAASHDSDQAAVDQRIQQIIRLQDPDILPDLRHLNEGRPEKYQVFWEFCRKFIEHKAETAVDDRRHGEITHLACAISVRDLVEQVAATCPPDTLVPSEQWVRLQFWPKNPTTNASLQYTGRLKVKYMVQARQIRMWHEDAHYASAMYRYLREMAIKYRDVCDLVFMDDKHKCKVGEPSFPVAAVERGKAVIVGVNGKKFCALDHDFTKCSVTPSVTMFCHIPEDIDGTFYSGQVYVGAKDSILEPSSANRHAAELSQILSSHGETKPVLLIYTDGGPDHNLKNYTTMISLINVFLEHDLDMLQAVRTPPYNSWKNPVE